MDEYPIDICVEIEHGIAEFPKFLRRLIQSEFNKYTFYTGKNMSYAATLVGSIKKTTWANYCRSLDSLGWSLGWGVGNVSEVIVGIQTKRIDTHDIISFLKSKAIAGYAISTIVTDLSAINHVREALNVEPDSQVQQAWFGKVIRALKREFGNEVNGAIVLELELLLKYIKFARKRETETTKGMANYFYFTTAFANRRSESLKTRKRDITIGSFPTLKGTKQMGVRQRIVEAKTKKVWETAQIVTMPVFVEKKEKNVRIPF